MKEKIEGVFEALKELDMKPTPNNVSIMNGVYLILREIYEKAEEAKDNAGNGRPAPDSQ